MKKCVNACRFAVISLDNPNVTFVKLIFFRSSLVLTAVGVQLSYCSYLSLGPRRWRNTVLRGYFPITHYIDKI